MNASLSMVPPRWRPRLVSQLIGRDRDLDWLNSTSGDRIVSGQPGSGKTHLLRALANEGRALFFLGEDRGAIRDALLSEGLDRGSGRAVVVDDAHHHSHGLQVLLHLRQELDATFPIIATCWPGGVEELQKVLGLGESDIHRLELLTRDEILEVYEAAGLTEDGIRARFTTPSEDVLRALVDLACNKPGLAVTLASLVQQGDLEDVFTGKALLREMVGPEKLFGKGTLSVLASFAVGGEAGMPMEVVASFLGISILEIREMAVGLEAGGALVETPERALCVEPRQLRSALLREVFFQGRAMDLEIDTLLQDAPNRERAIEAILWSKEAGSVLDSEWAHALVSGQGSPDLWKLYTSLGSEEALWALEHYPGEGVELAEQALRTAPEAVIPRLIAAGESTAPMRGNPRNPLGVLRSWVCELRPQLESLVRRRLVATAATAALRREESVGAALEALCIALSPTLSRSTRDAGDGSRVTTYSSHFTLEGVAALIELWNEAAQYLPEIRPEWLSRLHPTLWQWMHPGDDGKFELETATREEMLQHARQMLLDLSQYATSSVSVRADLERLSRDLGDPLGLDLDEDYEILFPDRIREPFRSQSWTRAEAAQECALESLANRWQLLDPHEIARRLVSLTKLARSAGHHRSRVQHLVLLLSDRVQEPSAWASALAEQDLPEALIEPFLEKAWVRGEEGWLPIAESLLTADESSGETFLMVMSRAGVPAPLLEKALEHAERFLFRFLDLRQDAPLDTMRSLLRHDAPRVAIMAASAEWLGSKEDPKRPRAGLEEDWREAILGFAPSSDDEGVDLYWLREIFGHDGELAFQWIERRVNEGLPGILSHDRTYEAAIERLDGKLKAQLLKLLELVAETSGCSRLVIGAVGGDPALYEDLLMHAVLRRHHLRPLSVETSFALNDAWAARAVLARRAEHPLEDIVYYTIHGEGAIFISGSGVSFWQGWRDAFARFEDDPREEVRNVAAAGVALAEERLAEAWGKKRRRELTGI